MKANADIKFNVSSQDEEIKYKIVDEEELEIDGDKFVKDYVEDTEATDPNYFKVRKDI